MVVDGVVKAGVRRLESCQAGQRRRGCSITALPPPTALPAAHPARVRVQRRLPLPLADRQLCLQRLDQRLHFSHAAVAAASGAGRRRVRQAQLDVHLTVASSALAAALVAAAGAAAGGQRCRGVAAG